MPTDLTANLPPLEAITSPALGTAAAAFYLGRSKRTLLNWACSKTGAVTPLRINGRWSWPTEQIRIALRSESTEKVNRGLHADH
jgi:hypothetical protein